MPSRLRRRGREDEPSWGIYRIPGPRHPVRYPPSWPDSMWSSSAAALPTSRRGWRRPAPARSGSTSRRSSWRRRARCRAEFGIDFPLHLGNAEETPYADASFDLVISEYGASIWCEPYRWIPEAARLLRPGGRLAFLANGVFMIVATPTDAAEDTPASERLERPYFGLHRTAWEDGSVNFYLPHGEWIRLLRANGFEVLDLIEVQAPEGAVTRHPDRHHRVGATVARGGDLGRPQDRSVRSQLWARPPCTSEPATSGAASSPSSCTRAATR